MPASHRIMRFIDGAADEKRAKHLRHRRALLGKGQTIFEPFPPAPPIPYFEEDGDKEDI